MHDICADTGSIQLFIHNDDDTPTEFVSELMRTVFGKSERDAITFTALFEGQDKVACGPYPAAVARALIESAEQLIRAAGHGLLITSEAATTEKGCDLCGALTRGTDVLLLGKTACLCAACLLAVRHASEEMPPEQFGYACVALDWHFAGIPRNQLVTRAREFPGHMRADVQVAVDKLFRSSLHFSGIHEEYRNETLAFAGLMKGGPQCARHRSATVSRRGYRRTSTGEMSPYRIVAVPKRWTPLRGPAFLSP
jgi:ATP-dependent Clp protease adapter protein ClpS